MKHFEPVFTTWGINRVVRVDSVDDAMELTKAFHSSKILVDGTLIRNSLFPSYYIDFANIGSFQSQYLELRGKQFTLDLIRTVAGWRCKNSQEEKDFKNFYAAVMES